MKSFRLSLALLFLLALSVLSGVVRIPAAHAATFPCGQTVIGKSVNSATNTFSMTELVQNHGAPCDPSPSLLQGIGVTQGSAYTINFDLTNMESAASSSFDAWIGFRRADSSNKYSLHFLTSTVEFRVRLLGNETRLGSASFTVPTTAAAHLRLVENGFTFTLYNRDTGAIILQASDPNQTFASGPTIAFYADGDTFVCWDNSNGSPS